MDHDWDAAEKRLRELQDAYGSIGLSGMFVLGLIAAAQKRFDAGERTDALWGEIFGIEM